MKKILLLILIFICLVILAFRFTNLSLNALLGVKEKAGIRVLSSPPGAQVLINGKVVGETPFEDSELTELSYEIKLVSERGSWQGKVRLNPGTLTVINRDLSPDSATSSGEILSLEKGHGATIVSFPSEAEVEIDAVAFGKTPTLVSIDPGEHTFVLKKTNFLPRSIKAAIPSGFNLTLSVDLALSEADLTTVSTPAITETPKLVVKNTPTGFLRVRDKPSLAGKEIAQVKPGAELVLLEELQGWDRVRLEDGKEGYVSVSYVEKKTQAPR